MIPVKTEGYLKVASIQDHSLTKVGSDCYDDHCQGFLTGRLGAITFVVVS
jgi:hypothetical protein